MVNFRVDGQSKYTYPVTLLPLNPLTPELPHAQGTYVRFLVLLASLISMTSSLLAVVLKSQSVVLF